MMSSDTMMDIEGEAPTVVSPWSTSSSPSSPSPAVIPRIMWGKKNYDRPFTALSPNDPHLHVLFTSTQPCIEKELVRLIKPLYLLFNKCVFGDKLTEKCTIEWSKQLMTTGGKFRYVSHLISHHVFFTLCGWTNNPDAYIYCTTNNLDNYILQD